MANKYRLLKDIDSPDCYAKAGTIGEWNEANDQVWFDKGRFFYHIASVQSRTNWFEEIKEKERIRISEFYYEQTTAHGLEYVFVTDKIIPKEKFKQIKETIERILNEDDMASSNNDKITFNGYEYIHPDEALIREKEAWQAARLHHPIAGMKYDTFQDYINSKSKQ